MHAVSQLVSYNNVVNRKEEICIIRQNFTTSLTVKRRLAILAIDTFRYMSNCCHSLHVFGNDVSVTGRLVDVNILWKKLCTRCEMNSN
jgi:hypothetical protein